MAVVVQRLERTVVANNFVRVLSAINRGQGCEESEVDRKVRETRVQFSPSAFSSAERWIENCASNLLSACSKSKWYTK